jgi:N-acetylneuraminic acid mutarotase
MILLSRHNFLRVFKQVILLGTTCFGLVCCTQPTPVVKTVVPITGKPMIVTYSVETPVEATREVTRQIIVTQEVEVPRLVTVTVTPQPTSTSTPISTPTAVPSPTATAVPSPTPTAVPSPTPVSAVKWSSAGSMAMARGFHTATLLRDGRVLIVGGLTALDTDTASAEIFDPTTTTFSLTGSLNTARHDHTATLLPDGRVLVVAGYGSGAWLSSAEIFDPATGQWTITQPVFAHGVTHTATLLKDGRILVMAGAAQSGSSGPDDRVEIFDPKTGLWQKAADHANTEANHTATLLADGRVLIAAGNADPAIYEPVSDIWQPAGKLAVERCFAEAVLLQDGRVLLMGGVLLPQGGTVLNSVEIYDPAGGTWQQAAPLAQARLYHTATLLPDGRVLIVGGWESYYGYEDSLLDTAEIYDDRSGSWSTAPPLSIGRVGHTATLLPDGRVLVTGGETSRGVFLNSAEVLGGISNTQ